MNCPGRKVAHPQPKHVHVVERAHREAVLVQALLQRVYVHPLYVPQHHVHVPPSRCNRGEVAWETVPQVNFLHLLPRAEVLQKYLVEELLRREGQEVALLLLLGRVLDQGGGPIGYFPA